MVGDISILLGEGIFKLVMVAIVGGEQWDTGSRCTQGGEHCVGQRGLLPNRKCCGNGTVEQAELLTIEMRMQMLQ